MNLNIVQCWPIVRRKPNLASQPKQLPGERKSTKNGVWTSIVQQDHHR